MRTILCALLVACGAVAALFEATAGFRAVTSETARRISVAEQPRWLPAVTLTDATGRTVMLADDLRRDGRIVLVTFFYSRCMTLCAVLGTEFQQLQRAIETSGVEDHVRLLSVSFDAQHDAPDVLRRYAGKLGASEQVWTFSTVTDDAQLRELLRTFGIVVIPDGLGGYQHNAAIHIVTPDGRLVGIHGIDEPAQALAAALRIAAAKT